MVCPWNRFAVEGDAALQPRQELQHPGLIRELALAPEEFNRKFKTSPIRRAKRRGYLRNVAVALGNAGDRRAMPSLEKAREDTEPMVQRHAAWALDKISKHGSGQ
jgi:epoxyqueuosine reductase